MKRIIECGTNPNDIVLDLFGGSGSTAIACQELNRRYIISELDSEMAKKSEEWLVQTKEKTKFFQQS
jgi:site-specific DNA-methyltransferase (adenine-specific)